VKDAATVTDLHEWVATRHGRGELAAELRRHVAAERWASTWRVSQLIVARWRTDDPGDDP
jgi:hypothetical protein